MSINKSTNQSQDINRLKIPSCSFSAYEKFKIPIDYMKGYDIYYANLKSSDKIEKQDINRLQLPSISCPSANPFPFKERDNKKDYNDFCENSAKEQSQQNNLQAVPSQKSALNFGALMENELTALKNENNKLRLQALEVDEKLKALIVQNQKLENNQIKLVKHYDISLKEKLNGFQKNAGEEKLAQEKRIKEIEDRYQIFSKKLEISHKEKLENFHKNAEEERRAQEKKLNELEERHLKLIAENELSLDSLIDQMKNYYFDLIAEKQTKIDELEAQRLATNSLSSRNQSVSGSPTSLSTRPRSPSTRVSTRQTLEVICEQKCLGFKTCKPPVFMKKALAFYNLGCNDFKVNGEPDMRIKENTIFIPERKN